MGFSLGSLFGSDYEELTRPKYYEDSDYRYAQDYLKSYGTNILEGNMNGFYSSLGQSGGQQFEDVLGLGIRDTMKSTEEALAKSGRARGGQLPAATAKAVSDMSIKARYDDYVRAQGEKSNLLTTGLNIMSGVRGAGQNEGVNRNDFAWKDYNAQEDELMRKAEADSQLGEMIGMIASIGMGAATGGMSFGLQGALAGGTDALTGGGTDFLSELGRINTKKKTNG